MTIDEELSKLEDDIRRLKIEYEVYFNGNADRPPRDRVYRVETFIKRYTGDQSSLNFGQRYKLNGLAQKYAVQNSLWKRRLMEKEEGRGQFAQQRRELEELTAERTVRVVCSDPEGEPEKVDRIFKAMIRAQRKVGQKVENVDPVRFRKYIRDKTKEIKASLGCDKVQFSVSVENGKVKFKAVKA
ncbi:MAG: MXAN_5187 C-terminal domain-containing protein [Terriglobia bacterium]